jgi:hemerythrin
MGLVERLDSVVCDAAMLRLAMKEDHRLLAEAITRVDAICTRAGPAPGAAGAAAACPGCPPDVTASCLNAVVELSGNVLALMIGHFERENVAMTALPATPETVRHCDAHRREHVAFSSTFNRTLATGHPLEAAAYAAALKDFILDWTRRHALRYDAELIALVDSAAPGSRQVA